MRPSIKISLDETERAELERRARGRKVGRGCSERARIVLLAAEGLDNPRIAEQVRVHKHTARKWRNRFAERGLDGLEDAPRRGRPRSVTDEDVAEVVHRTLQERPCGATHWSVRLMARASGHSSSTIHKIWRAHALQPHRSETFKLSLDPKFVDKARDIVGLYVDPPQHAVVLCVDEKSQIQALDRTQPLLPLRPGQVERRTHDDERHGTTSLFVALDVATGKVVGQCFRRHRSREFRRFLSHVEASVPEDMDIHVVMDNASTHKTREVRDWFERRPRWEAHFTPTSASWLNQVERFFANLTEKQLRRGVHRSTAELERVTTEYVETVNENPKPFRWHKRADDILASIRRFCRATGQPAPDQE